jgi:hypothetical protein
MMYTTDFDNESGRTHHKPAPEWTEHEEGASHTETEQAKQEEINSFPAMNQDPAEIKPPQEFEGALAY